MIKKLCLKIIGDKPFFKIAGDIAERFHDKDTGDYDDLKEKLYYWIKSGLKEK